jgi:hypothetical protein
VSEKEREMSGESPDLAGGRKKRGSSCSSLTFLFLGEGDNFWGVSPRPLHRSTELSSASSLHHKSIVYYYYYYYYEVPTS